MAARKKLSLLLCLLLLFPKENFQGSTANISPKLFFRNSSKQNTQHFQLCGNHLPVEKSGENGILKVKIVKKNVDYKNMSKLNYSQN